MVDLIVGVGGSVVLLVIGYLVGTSAERAHYRDIRAREYSSRNFPALNLRTIPDDWEVVSAGLVCGSVVVSLDYFKRFLAGLRGLVGGRVAAFESLLDRARREAILRVKEDAAKRGFDLVINLRLETSTLASGGGNRQGTAGVEVIAFGTGLKRSSS